jgi:hypothetical protein
MIHLIKRRRFRLIRRRLMGTAPGAAKPPFQASIFAEDAVWLCLRFPISRKAS